MAFGLGVLRLDAESFWALTPRELASAIEGVCGPAPLRTPPARTDLARLMARYPDQVED